MARTASSVFTFEQDRSMSSKPLRILYFRNARGISDVTGAESYVFALMQALDPAQVETRLLATVRPGQTDTPWIIEARRRGLPLQLVEVDSRFGMQDLHALRAAIRDWGADIVHTLDHRADIVGWRGARAENCALINAFFGWTNFTGGFSMGSLYAFLDRKVQARADAVITDSGYMASFAGSGARRSPVVVVHNGVDAGRFEPSGAHGDLRERFFGQRDVTVFGTVGRVHPNKGQLELIAAAKRLCPKYPSLRFLIIGAAPPGWEAYRDEVRNAITAAGLQERVVFDNVPSSDIPAVLSSLDALVSPSHVESFSYSLLEAMSMALPIIATDVGGNREMMVPDDSGIIIPAGDVDAIFNACQRLLDDAALRARLGQRARERLLEHFTLAAMARRTTDIYRAVLASRRERLAPAAARERLQRLSAVPVGQ
jgi:glycosyltransferase involved in cell wall biosynthesis